MEEDSTLWNAKDAVADNYLFMMLSSFFTDQSLFKGRMVERLNKEEKLTWRVKALPDVYSFKKKWFSLTQLGPLFSISP